MGLLSWLAIIFALILIGFGIYGFFVHGETWFQSVTNALLIAAGIVIGLMAIL